MRGWTVAECSWPGLQPSPEHTDDRAAGELLGQEPRRYAMLQVAIAPIIVDGTVIEAAGHVTRVELIYIVGAVVAALGIVWGVPHAAQLGRGYRRVETDEVIEQ